jgi:hypothetical protein
MQKNVQIFAFPKKEITRSHDQPRGPLSHTHICFISCRLGGLSIKLYLHKLLWCLLKIERDNGKHKLEGSLHTLRIRWIEQGMDGGFGNIY